MSDLKEKILNFLKSETTDKKPIYVSGPQNNQKNLPKVLYSGPVWDDEEIAVSIESLISGKWLSSGEKVRKFEKEFAKEVCQNHALMVNSGSSANLVMIAALKKCLGWKDGDEVIVSCVGFPTTIAPLVQNNLKPVFVDISWEDLNWDLTKVEESITDKTVAVFSSPVLGNLYDLDRLKTICEKRKVSMIGDNCDSLGTKWKDKHIFEYFIASSCSFYPAHHITTGEGGMVVSNRPDIIMTARSFAWWGRDCYCVGSANLLSCGTCGKRFDKWMDNYDGVIDHKYYFTNVGYNLKPLDFQGAIGSVQLKKLSMIHQKRRANKNNIQSYFEDIEGVRIPKEHQNSETSWFGVPVICDSYDLKLKLVRHLESNGIQTRNYFAGNILCHPGYEKLGNWKEYPNANKVLRQVFFVGCSPNYSTETMEYIENVLKQFEE